MIRIALCDDNKEDMLQLHQKIIEWYRENSKNQSVSITEYSDSVYLSSVIDAGDSHDVFFLDVEMPKVDGFQLADKIRNKLPAAIIVFLTSHSELAPDGYKFRALRYVSKLVLSQKLPEALEAVQKEFSRWNPGIWSFHIIQTLCEFRITKYYMFSIFCEAHRFIRCDKASSKIIED